MIAFMTIVAASIASECAPAWLEVAPLAAVVPPRPLFVLNLQGQAQGESVTDQVVLRKGEQVTRLQLISTELGANSRQVVLQPIEPLRAGGWQLEIASGTALANVVFDSVLARFEVSNEARTAAPSFVTLPHFVGVRSEAYGCGTASYAEVELSLDDPHGLVEVSLDTGVTVVLPITTSTSPGPRVGSQSVVQIGTGMCGGPVRLLDGKTYTAKLTPLSRAGERGQPAVVIFSTKRRAFERSSFDLLQSLSSQLRR